MDGKPIYRKGYHDVLAGRKTIEEIMGAGSLQALIVSYLNGMLWNWFDGPRYFVPTGEPGVHLNHRDNQANDVAIFDQAVLTPDRIETFDWTRDIEVLDGRVLNIGGYLAGKGIEVDGGVAK